ncbi:hypothetical protein [Wenyingzhuangia sp. 2_MG-2023]|uniref:hypothetical protein n=1 Tax=Wenyingzhuangia sp. 2_MG-2023 TaxID=3062639 RepID=UPI0026E1B3D1|nr:hypothetical protein [Wenyingzhuangia sp. 2_MG-2023]MDO6739475.1 hypothetical protein [Wenyingzhuangia sp. 2_MG-2023]
MNQNKDISEKEFKTFYEPLLKGYGEEFKAIIKSKNDICELIYLDSKIVSIDKLISLIKKETDIYVKSIVCRLIGVREIIYCRENKQKLDIKFVWELISKSIKIIPIKYTISSIGSQGFLSIPLYKFDESLESFDFIRLHIWDDSLNQYIDTEKCENFSIHTHTFFAESWVITGEIINNRFDYNINSKNSKHSFFKVVYNDSLNEVNQHTSKAVNEKIDIELYQTSEEIHFKNGNYKIDAGKLHKSGHTNSPLPSATFFSFTGKNGLDKSIVIGPKHISESEINRKMIIDPTELLNKINTQI